MLKWEATSMNDYPTRVAFAIARWAVVLGLGRRRGHRAEVSVSPAESFSWPTFWKCLDVRLTKNFAFSV
jgi:hypothetical protein